MTKQASHVKAITLRLDLRDSDERFIAERYDELPAYRKSDYLRRLLTAGIASIEASLKKEDSQNLS